MQFCWVKKNFSKNFLSMARTQPQDQDYSLLARGSGGFSLLEVSVALMVVGLMAGGSIPLYLRYREQKAHELTDKRQEFIMMALAQYALAKQALPCPSQDLHGVAQKTCTQDGAWIGYIPYRTLGLSKEEALTGEQRPWTYAVWSKITYNDKSLEKLSVEERMRALFTAQDNILTLYDREGQSAGEAYDPLALILVNQSPPESLEDRKALIEHPYASQDKKTAIRAYGITRRHLMAHYAHYSWNPMHLPEKPSESSSDSKESSSGSSASSPPANTHPTGSSAGQPLIIEGMNANFE